jgi:hypothetical protein
LEEIAKKILHAELLLVTGLDDADCCKGRGGIIDSLHRPAIVSAIRDKGREVGRPLAGRRLFLDGAAARQNQQAHA